MRARSLTVAGIAAVVGLLLAGCTGGGTEPSASPTASTSATSTPEPTSTLSPAAQRAKTAFDAANRSLAARNDSADDHQIVDGLVGAGFEKSAMQITPDTTTIGRDVDSIEVSVLAGDTCLVGQFRGPSYWSTTSPVLSTGRCLLGTTQAIDW